MRQDQQLSFWLVATANLSLFGTGTSGDPAWAGENPGASTLKMRESLAGRLSSYIP